jgi:lysine-specific histone demethylase 1
MGPAASQQREQQQQQAPIDRRTQLLSQIHELKLLQLQLEKDRQQFSMDYPTKYWTASAKSVIDWHVANLEFANATTLETLSLEHWDQDDANEFTGEHLTVREGFGTLPKALSTELDVRLRCKVTAVECTGGGVKVAYEQSSDPSPNGGGSGGSGGSSSGGEANVALELRADAVLCTLPLGVLKEGAVAFDPPLPGWKQASIERLGFGLLNKVILCFDAPFWTQKTDTFGSTQTPDGVVGELYMFWNFMPCTGQPVLLALNAGAAAITSEAESDATVVGKAVTVLRKIFGHEKVPEPAHSHVTRWRQDPFARGSYSYIAVDATGDDYDTLARPVVADGHEKAELFFAGEHTNRDYPATVHGAMLSGLREAGRIVGEYDVYEDIEAAAATATGEAAAVGSAAAAGVAMQPATSGDNGSDTLSPNGAELSGKRKTRDEETDHARLDPKRSRPPP